MLPSLYLSYEQVGDLIFWDCTCPFYKYYADMHQRATNHSYILWLLGIKIGEKQYFFFKLVQQKRK